MKTIKIAGKEYILEYSFEAALYGECTEKVINLFDGVSKGQGDDGEKDAIKSLCSAPNTVLHMFYAGLMENNHVDNLDDAKKLLKQYFSENKDKSDVSNNTFYGMVEYIIGIMEEDGFFKQIGLGKEEEEAKKTPKTPQDRKPRAAKVSKK